MNDWVLPGTSFISGCKLHSVWLVVVANCVVFGAKCFHFAKNNRSIVHFSGNFGGLGVVRLGEFGYICFVIRAYFSRQY